MRIGKFELLIHKSTKQSFQDLFVKIMSFYDSSFHAVKPHGKFGDKGNDGWSAAHGTYYQVYAPDDLSKNITTAINKLKEDFLKIKSFWDAISEVKNYIFVVNDKFQGVPPIITEALNEIKELHHLDSVSVIDANQLQRILFELNKEQINNIIGPDFTTVKSQNDIIFSFWYESVDAANMTYNANYLPHETHSVKFTRAFINKLHSFYNNSFSFLNEPSSNHADTGLICAIMDFRAVAKDVIQQCEEYENSLDPLTGIITYWVENPPDYNFILYKKWVLKSLFYHLIKSANYIINTRRNIIGDFSDINYIAYHQEWYPNFPIFGDIEPSPVEYIGTNEVDAFYPGLASIKKFIKKQVLEQN